MNKYKKKLFKLLALIFNSKDAVNACNEIGGTRWVIKAQVHAGGRGKAGGVELIDSPEMAEEFSKKWKEKTQKV